MFWNTVIWPPVECRTHNVKRAKTGCFVTDHPSSSYRKVCIHYYHTCTNTENLRTIQYPTIRLVDNLPPLQSAWQYWGTSKYRRRLAFFLEDAVNSTVTSVYNGSRLLFFLLKIASKPGTWYLFVPPSWVFISIWNHTCPARTAVVRVYTLCTHKSFFWLRTSYRPHKITK